MEGLPITISVLDIGIHSISDSKLATLLVSPIIILMGLVDIPEPPPFRNRKPLFRIILKSL